MHHPGDVTQAPPDVAPCRLCGCRWPSKAAQEAAVARALARMDAIWAYRRDQS
jgi:hypothetical protein